jgi:hypothetical protein
MPHLVIRFKSLNLFVVLMTVYASVLSSTQSVSATPQPVSAEKRLNETKGQMDKLSLWGKETNLLGLESLELYLEGDAHPTYYSQAGSQAPPSCSDDPQNQECRKKTSPPPEKKNPPYHNGSSGQGDGNRKPSTKDDGDRKANQ